MTTHQDPYATEAETDALLAADTRTPAERRLAALFDARGGNEQGAESEAVLRGIALELIEAQDAQPTDRHTLQAQGKHPAPCARFCESTAFGIKIRSLEAQLRAALAAPQQAQPNALLTDEQRIRWAEWRIADLEATLRSRPAALAAPQPAPASLDTLRLKYSDEIYSVNPKLAAQFEADIAAIAASQPAQDQGLIATLAGLEASIGHLSAIVDQQRALLAEVEDVFGRDERGIPFEDGESRLIDKVRANLACIAAPQAPQPLPAGCTKVELTAEQQAGLTCRASYIPGLAAPQPAQEPLMYRIWNDEAGKWELTEESDWPAEPLYTTQQAPQPLTDEELLFAYNSEGGLLNSLRAVQAAILLAAPQPAQEPVAEVVMAVKPPNSSPAWLPFKTVYAPIPWLDSVPVGTKLYTTPQAPQRELLSYEQDNALCEAFCNEASDSYFTARPQLDSDVNRRIFCAGHRKAWIECSAAHGITSKGPAA